MKFIAHKGYSKCFLGNTLGAFNAVIKHVQNGDSLIGIELDIQMTSDKKIPVFHDIMTNNNLAPVSEVSFSDLQKYFQIKNSDALFIPTIEETFNLVSHKTELCFDIKKADYNIDTFLSCLREKLEEYKPVGDVVLSSFSGELLNAVIMKTRDLDVKYGFIFKTWKDFDNLSNELYSRIDYLHPKYKLLLHGNKRFNSIEKPFQCWTVNDQAEVELIIKQSQYFNLRSIMTDDIEFSSLFKDS